MTLPAERMPPIPDAYLVPAEMERVIAWIRGQQLPTRYGEILLRRWSRYVGVQLTAADFARVATSTLEPLDG